MQYLIVEPLDGYAERVAVEQLFKALVAEYGKRAALAFESGDGKHQIYRISASDET